MPLASGYELGPYEILVPIGVGGFGEVFKARNTRLDRTLAVKMMPKYIPALCGGNGRSVIDPQSNHI
jgi:hypothetical protein